MYPMTISSLVWWMYLIKRSVFSDLRKMKRDVNGWTLQRSEMGVSLSYLPPASRLHLCSVSLLFSTHFFSLFLPPSSSHIFLSLFLSFINPMWILHSLYFYIFSPFKTSSCGMKLVFFFPLLSRFVSSDFSGTEIPFLPLGWLSRAQETWARIIYNLSDPLSPSSSDLSFFKNHVLIQPVFAKYLMFLTQQAAALCFALSPWGQFVWSTRQKHFPLNLLWMWS